MSVAASLSPPAGAAIYGTKFPDRPPSYLLGPAHAPCQGAWSNADGGETMTATSTSNQSQGVAMVLNAGGIAPQTFLACSYIPAIRAAGQAFSGTSPSCAHPPEDAVKQIPTGTKNLYAAAVWVPAQVKDPNLRSSGDGMDPTVALYTAQLFPVGAIPGNQDPSAVAQMVVCTLPVTQRDICTASLAFFLATESDVASHVSATSLMQMQRTLTPFLASY